VKFPQLVSLAFLLSFTLNAEPWINTRDLYLKTDIQLLADHNLLTIPTNHWPLNWSDVSQDLTKINAANLPLSLQMSYQRVMFYFNQAKQKHQPTKIRIAIANKTPKFQYFGSTQREKGELSSERNITQGNFSANIAIQQTLDPADGKKLRLDNSYIAYKLGNWNIIGGSVPMWWGPGWDSALLMSNNARPVPGISINRQNALPFENKWLSWIGPWSFTSFWGELTKDRTIPNTKLWSSRLSFRPISSVDVGFSRSTMWAGEGRPSGVGDFLKIIIPNESANDDSGSIKNVNDLASFDLRWHGQFLNHPIGVNYQMGFEDYASIIPSKRSYLLGFDTDIFNGNSFYKLFIEASATYLNTCECIYEHHIYKSGYTYRNKIIGSTFGKNAQTISAGIIAQPNNDTYWQSRFSYIEQNLDNKHINFNELNADNYDEIYQLYSSYRFVLLNSRWEFGLTLRKSKNTLESSNNAEISLNWEYKIGS